MLLSELNCSSNGLVYIMSLWIGYEGIVKKIVFFLEKKLYNAYTLINLL